MVTYIHTFIVSQKSLLYLGAKYSVHVCPFFIYIVVTLDCGRGDHTPLLVLASAAAPTSTLQGKKD